MTVRFLDVHGTRILVASLGHAEAILERVRGKSVQDHARRRRRSVLGVDIKRQEPGIASSQRMSDQVTCLQFTRSALLHISIVEFAVTNGKASGRKGNAP